MGAINDDIYVNGALSARTFTPPAGSVTNNAVAAAAGIAATKLQHQYEKVAQPQDSTVTAAVSRKVMHVVCGLTGTITDFKVGAVTANVGAATVTIDLKKNGASILTAPITLDSATAAFALKAGVLASSALAAGDVLEFHITAAAAGGGTLALGVFGRLNLVEDAQ